jgi:predicted amidophosphoribosyltransferase
MIGPSPRRFRREPEPPGRWLAAHQKRAGLGAGAAGRSRQARAAIKAWKRTAPFDPAELAGFAAAVADLVRAWSPVLPPRTILTVPPQGASAPGPYAARELGRAVADALGLPFAEILSRTEPKRWHGPHHALRQAPFACKSPAPAPTMVLVVDDLVTTGRTMRLAVEAIRAAGVAAFGFGFSGV